MNSEEVTLEGVQTGSGKYVSMPKRITAECPIACIDLSTVVTLNLRKYGGVETIGDLVNLAKHDEIGLVRNIGRIREKEIIKALVLACLFGHPSYHRDD